ncbi:hypothetical protein CC78DRAFT_455634, partial [Lojkania enalia]
GTLGTCIRTYGKFQSSLAANFTVQILRRLRYLYSEDIIHRDLKADEVLLDFDVTYMINGSLLISIVKHPYDIVMLDSRLGFAHWLAAEVVLKISGYTGKSVRMPSKHSRPN